MSVHFSSSDCLIPQFNESLITNWISLVAANHNFKIGRINYLFCSDEYIYKTNVQFLQHDTYTDIITFDYVEGSILSGDILISVDRVEDNARLFNVSFYQELCRVIIHGILHLIGFKDKTESDAATMRAKENDSLELLQTINV